MHDKRPSDTIIDQPQRAADGGHVPGACNTLGEFIRSLEDGQFDADCYEAVKELSAALNEHAGPVRAGSVQRAPPEGAGRGARHARAHGNAAAPVADPV